MTSRQIECFLSVANSLNFTQSAKELYASQSTVSRQISLLEEELGFELFVRGNNYVRLTAAGITMLMAFQNISTELSRHRQIASSQNAGASGCLRFGFYCNMFIESFLIATIRRFHEQYPNIALSYECFPTGDLAAVIREHLYDLVFIHDFDQLNPTEFVSQTICHTNQFLVYGKAHALAAKENLCFEDFRQDIFWSVANRTSPQRSAAIQKIFHHFGISQWNTKTAPNFETILLNVRLGNGVMFLDSITHQLDPRYYSTLLLPEELAPVGINVTWLKSNLNPAIPLFTNQFVRE